MSKLPVFVEMFNLASCSLEQHLKINHNFSSDCLNLNQALARLDFSLSLKLPT